MAGPVAAAAEVGADDAAPLPEAGASPEEAAPDEPAPDEPAADEPALDEPAAVAAAADELDGVELEDALSVRPDPQAASETARVRAPAAATSLRDVVLRMKPLSAGETG